MTAAVRISGLREFRNGVRDMKDGTPKALRLALNDAADVIVSDARPRVPSRSGDARRSVRARSTQTKARVSGGGRKAPYYPWLDFGGRIPRGPRRPFLKEGRFIYNAYFRRRGEFVDHLRDNLIDVAKQAGIEVT